MASSTSAASIGYALSAQQRAVWCADARSVDAWAGAWRRVDRLPQSSRLSRRFEALAASREILRTRFAIPDAGDEPLQLIDDRVGVATLDVDLRHVADAADAVDTLLRRCRTIAACQGLHAWILRLRLADESLGVAVLVHALAVDRLTLDRVLHHLLADEDESEPPLQYADYVGWQESLAQEEQAHDARAVWNRIAPSAGGRRSPAPVVRQRETTLTSVLTQAEWARLQADCRTHRLQPGVAIGVSWLAALRDAGVAAGRPVCVELDAREAAGLPGFLGPMMHAVPLAIAVADARPVLMRCQAVQQMLDAVSPWIEYAPPAAGPSAVCFAIAPEMHDAATRFPSAGRAFELSLRWRDAGGQLVIEIAARGARAASLPAVTRDLQQRLRQFPAEAEIDPGERAAASVRDRSGDLLAAIDRHARVAPDRLALCCAEATLTYGVLDRQSGAVARALRARGVTAGSVVALHLPPSLDLVIGLLGIAKAGATFLPIDSKTPSKRAQYMLAQAQATLVLCGAAADRTIVDGHAVLPVREAVRRGLGRADQTSVPGPAPDATAYILFTSGSTGQPKGVAVSWRALMNYLTWCLDRYAIDEGMSIVQTSIGFDLTLTTLLAPLAAGLTTSLVPETNDIPSFARLIERLPCLSFLKATPAQLRLLDQRLASARVPLPRVLVVGGEALRFEDFGTWLRSGPVTVINEYGPTEATVGCCCQAIDDLAAAQGAVPIGRPIPGASIYLLDGRLRPVAPGERGEICIAGEGLAQGYVRAPQLTAERFCPDPFAPTPGARMYRTGDFASADADGVLTYHGRVDDQVKIRGHRVELAEVAGQLKACDDVMDAVACIVPGAGGESSLAGYVVLAPDAIDRRVRAATAAHVDEWRRVFEDSYQTAAGQRFAGWSSSYTGQPIPESEMQAWVDETVASLLDLAPRRLLEIGCGTGLLATRLVPHLEVYTGIDISRTAIESLQQQFAREDMGSCRVDLHVCAAHEWQPLSADRYDTIVLNSIVQYLPDASDLRRLLRDLLRHLAPGGRMFVGDVRNLDLLPALLCAVEWQRGDRGISSRDWRRRVRQRLYAERELNLSPAFFFDLPTTLDAVTHVDVRLKQARNDNELTRFRYDAVVYTAPAMCVDPQATRTLAWTTEVQSLEHLRTRLREEQPDTLVLRGIPHGRTLADEERWQRIEQAADDLPAAGVLDREPSRAGVDPADLVEIARSCGYESRASWTGSGSAAFDAIVWTRGTPIASRPQPHAAPAPETRQRANRPLAPRLAADLLPELTARLRDRLPDYMIPSYLLVLDALPLDQHGKVALRQLPWPTIARPTTASFQPAATPLEARLCRVWAEVLGLERVGVDDSFFSLGGHSLLAIKLAYRIKTDCQCDVPLRQIIEAQTVRALARVMADTAPAAPPDAAGAASRAEEAALVPDPDAWHDPFPLTDVQQAYVAGRSPEYGLGGVSAHCYLELESPRLDVVRLELALNRLTAIHGMLRAVIHADGHQHVVPRVPGYRFAVHDLGGLDPVDRERALLRLRRRMSHEVLPLGRWPLLDVRVSSLPEGRARVHLSLDNLLFDGLSMEILTAQLRTLYNDPFAPVQAPSIAFRDCVLHERRQREGAVYARAQAYWLNRLPEFPSPPDLCGSRVAPVGTTYKRLSAVLPAARWARLKSLAIERRLTASAFLCTAFSDVVAMWSKNERFCLHLTFFNRPPIHPAINAVVGDFTSLTLLEVDTSPASFAARARAIQQRLADDLQHSQPGGVWLLRELGRLHASRRPQPAVVFTSTLGLEGLVPRPAAALPFQPGFSASQTPQVGLDHSVYESEGALHVTWDYPRGLFEAGMPEEMFSTYVQHLERLASMPDAWDQEARPALSAIDARLIAAVNDTAWPHPGGLLHDDIWTQIATTPEALAVQTPSASLTYRDLGGWTAGLIDVLHARGADAGDLVAIWLDKGWEQVVATVAISSIGAAYVPIDPAWPDARVRRVLAQCTPRAVIVQRDRASRLEGTDAPAIRIEDVTPATAPQRPPAAATSDPNPLAYVLFTSGTTGTPKGVAIRHAGAVNTIRDLRHRFGIGPADRCLQLSNLTFDLSVFDIFGTLSAGGTLVIPRDAQWDPAHWHELVMSHGVTIWNSVPTLFEMYVLHLSERAGAAPPLRIAMLSGDWVPVSLPDRARALMPAIDVISLGGATEASIWSVWYPIGRVDPEWTSIPYGLPMRNQQLYVVDRHLAPRPRSVVGQIAIAGAGLADGYWRDAAMTAARFPLSPALGGRIYLTGDLGRLRPDGNLEILGREDNQVKIHGYRIELGDVEAALSRLSVVKDAVAKAIPTRDGSGKRLVAYVVPAEGRTCDVAQLRAQLTQALPAYMIPADICVLAALPLTANGKIDRQALPVPDQTGAASREQTFQDDLERELAAAWHEVLGAPVADREADFFAIGGDSMKTIQLMNWIRRRFGREVSLRGFLAEPTIAGLAMQLQSRAGVEPIAPAAAPAAAVEDDAAAGDAAFPLTDLQFSYWLGRSDTSGATRASSHTYNEFRVQRLPWHAFVDAYLALLRRHAMLRAQVRPDARQAIAPLTSAYVPTLVDLRHLDEAGRATALARLRRGLSHRVYPSVNSPLLTVAAARLPGDAFMVHVSMDLLICDGYSARIINRDLAQLLTPDGRSLPPLDTSFRDAVQAARAFEASAEFGRSRDYWHGRLDAFPPAPALPLRVRRPTRTRSRFTRHEWRMAAEAWAALRAESVTRGLTASGLLCAAFAQTLGLWSARRHFALNVTLFDRFPHHPQVNDLVGVFTTTLLLEIEHQRVPFATFAQRVQSRLWSDIEHRHFGGIRVIRELRKRGRLDGAGYPVVFTSTLGAADDGGRPFPWRGESTYAISQTSGVLIDCQVAESAGHLHLNWDVVDDAFEPGSVPRMFTMFTRLLDLLYARSDAWAMSCR